MEYASSDAPVSLAVVGSTLYLYIGATVACRQKRKAESLVKTGCYTGAVGAPDTLYRESSSRSGSPATAGSAVFGWKWYYVFWRSG